MTHNIQFIRWGIYPREVNGLAGILFTPLIHADCKHLINNSLPLLFLVAGIFYFYKKIAFKIFFWVYFMTGLWVWASARESYHIGASGLIYGFAFFLFFSGVIRKSKKLLSLSLLVAFLYGGMVWGVFPIKYGVSWESHLWGAVAGTFLAFYYRHLGPARKKYSWEIEELREAEENSKTKENYN